MEEKILTMAGLAAGAGEEERPLLEMLCTAETDRWRQRLQADHTPESCGAAFWCAAALCAAADLAQSRGCDGVESFAAGEVSVRGTGANSASADALRRTAERLMAPYVREESVVFRRVRG